MENATASYAETRERCPDRQHRTAIAEQLLERSEVFKRILDIKAENLPELEDGPAKRVIGVLLEMIEREESWLRELAFLVAPVEGTS